MTPTPVERAFRQALAAALGGRSLDVVAQLVPCSPWTLSRILRGKPCTLATAGRIAEALGLEILVAIPQRVGDLDADLPHTEPVRESTSASLQRGAP